MQGIGKRLKAARTKAGLSQQEVADKAGVTQTAIAELESGRTRRSTRTRELAAAVGTTAKWLEGEGPLNEPEQPWTGAAAVVARSYDRLIEVAGAEFARMPVYDIRFAAGAGAVNDDETPIDYHLISMSLLRSMTDAPLNMIGMFQAAGDSMEETIHNRDWVAVDLRLNRAANPGIYALVFEGEGLLKRVSRHLETGAITLISDNKRYEPQVIKKPDRLTVVGRVIFSIRRH
jgi:phage repressor protein C with HTH and peptisase S24 domain